MRFLYKTDYDQDIRLVRHSGYAFWYGLLLALLIALPWAVSDYLLDQAIFIGIYAIAGLGLMLVVGYTGLVSLGHAAFLGIGAYTEAILTARGWPFPLSVSAAVLAAASAGVIVGLPALRVRGIYLAIATIALGTIVEEILARWESVTGGNAGLSVSTPRGLFGFIGAAPGFYYLTLAIAISSTLVVLNLLRSPTGRAFVAVRDSETSARSLGIHVARTKTTAFALSAALTGLAGALYAHKIRFLSPDQFTVLQSVELLMLVFVGGVGSVHGAVLGAVFLIALPQMIAIAKDFLPPAIGGAAGLQSAVFGALIVGFVLFEPLGLYGRWVKIRHYLEMFPFYRRGTYRRVRVFQRTERNR